MYNIFQPVEEARITNSINSYGLRGYTQENCQVTLENGLYRIYSHDSTYADDPETLARVKAARGHVVLRVLPGGDSFYVYMLDDTDMEYKVKGIYGPYYSK